MGDIYLPGTWLWGAHPPSSPSVAAASRCPLPAPPDSQLQAPEPEPTGTASSAHSADAHIPVGPTAQHLPGDPKGCCRRLKSSHPSWSPPARQPPAAPVPWDQLRRVQAPPALSPLPSPRSPLRLVPSLALSLSVSLPSPPPPPSASLWFYGKILEQLYSVLWEALANCHPHVTAEEMQTQLFTQHVSPQPGLVWGHSGVSQRSQGPAEATQPPRGETQPIATTPCPAMV